MLTSRISPYSSRELNILIIHNYIKIIIVLYKLYNFEYRDAEYSDTEYSDTEYSDTEYSDTEYSDTEYSDTEYSDTEYNDIILYM